MSKILKSQYEQKIITKHILANTSISKENQTVKFGQLIEFNVIIIFL